MSWHMPATPLPERHVKLFKNGRNQAVRIPREFELPGEDAIMRKEGDRLSIEPTQPKSLSSKPGAGRRSAWTGPTA
jgi:virulence-associated protein VagC